MGFVVGFRTWQELFWFITIILFKTLSFVLFQSQELLQHRLPDWEKLTQSKDMTKETLKIMETLTDLSVSCFSLKLQLFYTEEDIFKRWKRCWQVFSKYPSLTLATLEVSAHDMRPRCLATTTYQTVVLYPSVMTTLFARNIYKGHASNYELYILAYSWKQQCQFTAQWKRWFPGWYV